MILAVHGVGLIHRLGNQFRGPLGELLERAIERFAVGGRQDFRKPHGKVERVRRHFFVHRPSRRREREKGFAHVGAVGAPHQQFALFHERDRARHFGLVHMGVRADGLAGHDAVLAERHQHPPFRNADAVASRIDPRQRQRHEARHHVELVGQEFFEFQRRLFAGNRRLACRIVGDAACARPLAGRGVSVRGFAAPRHGGNMAELRVPRNDLGPAPNRRR